MKPFIRFNIGKVWFDLGWFPGNPPKLFGLEICEAIEDYPPPKIMSIVVFSVQIIKASFSCGFDF